jgi:tetratricopeptide (TPR) repeat protein
VDDLAVAHAQLGNIYDEAGVLDQALSHWQQAGNYFEKENNLYDAGKLRRNVALALAKNGRPSDALLYARAALRNFELYGQGAAEMIQETQGLIGEIEQAMKGK